MIHTSMNQLNLSTFAELVGERKSFYLLRKLRGIGLAKRLKIGLRSEDLLILVHTKIIIKKIYLF